MRSKGLSLWLDRLAYGLFLCGVVGAVGMTVLVFVSTLSRYLFNIPWHFANELTGLLFFSLTFLTIPHVFNQGGIYGSICLPSVFPLAWRGLRRHWRR
jgi:TRAP-type C4-dicarboxylate transport system permease small subunit